MKWLKKLFYKTVIYRTPDMLESDVKKALSGKGSDPSVRAIMQILHDMAEESLDGACRARHSDDRAFECGGLFTLRLAQERITTIIENAE